jgi:glycosyltransferase involved in cell wall biosynthesis
MACGVPVVASRVGANIDVVTKDCGFLVSNSTQWAAALIQLYEHPLMRQKMGASCRKRVENYYSLDYSLPILSSVIHTLIEKKN